MTNDFVHILICTKIEKKSLKIELCFWAFRQSRRAFRSIFFRYRSKRMPLQSLTQRDELKIGN